MASLVQDQVRSKPVGSSVISMTSSATSTTNCSASVVKTSPQLIQLPHNLLRGTTSVKREDAVRMYIERSMLQQTTWGHENVDQTSVIGKMPRTDADLDAFCAELNLLRKVIMRRGRCVIQDEMIARACKMGWRRRDGGVPKNRVQIVEAYEQQGQYDDDRKAEVFEILFGMYRQKERGWLTEAAEGLATELGIRVVDEDREKLTKFDLLTSRKEIKRDWNNFGGQDGILIWGHFRLNLASNSKKFGIQFQQIRGG